MGGSGRWWKRAALLPALVVPLVTPAASGRSLLGEDELRVLGLELAAEPASQVVPPGVPTVVHVRFGAAGGATFPVGALPSGMRVRAELSGPGLAAPLGIEAAPGEDLAVPALDARGDYRLERIRLTDPAGLVFPVTPGAVDIHVQDILVSSVSSRPLTLDEVRARGLDLDPAAYQVWSFELALGLDQGTVEIELPMVVPAEGPPFALPEMAGPLELGDLAQSPPRPYVPEVVGHGFVPTVQQAEGEVPARGISGVMLFPQAVAALRQHHAVTLLVGNAAPAASPLAVRDLGATFTLPPGRLELAATTPPAGAGGSVPVRDPGADGRTGTGDDQARIAPGAAARAEAVTRGLEEGLHVVDVALAGTLDGLPGGPAALSGHVRGTVLVRNPRFSLTFLVPGVVEAGREFTLETAITNTGVEPAYLVSLTLPRSAVSGATLVGDDRVLLPAIAPGESQVARFRLRALVGGRVAATRFVDPGRNLEGRFELALAVGDEDVPLSPEVLVFPPVVERLPAALRTALAAFLGTAWANATAPAGTLPAGMAQLHPGAVRRAAAQVADAAQRLDLGEDEESALGHLLLRLLGAEGQDQALDRLRRRSERWAEAGAAFGDALGAGAGSAAGLAERMARTHFHDAPLLAAALDPASGALALRVEDETGRALGGAEGARGLASGELLPLGQGRSLALVAPPAAWHLVAVESPGGGTGTLALVVPRPAAAGTRPALERVTFPAFSLAAGEQATVEARPGGPFVLHTPAGDLAGSASPIDPPPLALVSATVARAVDPGHHVVALAFNRPVDAASIEDPRAFAFAGEPMAGQRVVGVRAQAAGRFVYLRLRNPVPPGPPSEVRLHGVRDREGGTMADTSRVIAVPPGGEPWGTVRGVAIDGRGRAAAGVPVVLQETVPSTLGGGYVRQSTAEATTGDAGGFRFWYVRQSGRAFTVEGRDPATGEGALAAGVLRGPGQELPVELRFIGRGDVSGRVVADGQPVASALVTGRSPGRPDFRQALSGDDGRYRLDGLPVGAVELSARTRLGRLGAATALVPNAGASVDAGDLVVVDAGRGTVQGRAVRDGQPLGGAPVVVRSDGLPVAWSTWTLSGADGGYRFAGVPAGTVNVEALDPADWSIVRARAGGALAAGQALVLDLAWTAGNGAVSGLVVDAQGRAVPGAVVGMDFPSRNGPASPARARRSPSARSAGSPTCRSREAPPPCASPGRWGCAPREPPPAECWWKRPRRSWACRPRNSPPARAR